MNKDTLFGAISFRDASYTAQVAQRVLADLNFTTYCDHYTDSVAMYVSTDDGKNYDLGLIVYTGATTIKWTLLLDNAADSDSINWWSRVVEVVSSINNIRFSFENESDRIGIQFVSEEDFNLLT